MTTSAYVVAKLTVPESDTETPDAEGTWLVTLHDDCPPELIEEAALETFHAGVSIDELDDFEIKVVDAEGRRFENQSQEEGIREKYPLESWGDLEGNVGPVDMLVQRPSP